MIFKKSHKRVIKSDCNDHKSREGSKKVLKKRILNILAFFRGASLGFFSYVNVLAFKLDFDHIRYGMLR